MDISIVSSSDEVCFSPKLFDRSENTCSIATEEGCTSNANDMLLTNEGTHLCTSCTIPTYLLQAT